MKLAHYMKVSLADRDASLDAHEQTDSTASTLHGTDDSHHPRCSDLCGRHRLGDCQREGPLSTRPGESLRLPRLKHILLGSSHLGSA